MSNEHFTDEQKAYLLSLDAVRMIRDDRLYYSRAFRHECMRRYRLGHSPEAIFADAGMPVSLVGRKRIERAIHRWKNSEGDVSSADLIQRQATRIVQLESQVKALKALDKLASATNRGPRETTRVERLTIIANLKAQDDAFDVAAACEALEVE